MAKKRRKSSSRSPSARTASTRSPSARTPSGRTSSAHTSLAQVGEPSSSADQQPSGEQQEQQPTFPEFEMPELEPEPATEQLSKPESMGLLRLGLIMIGVLGTGIILFVLAILVFIAPLGTVYTTLAPSVCATFSCIEHAYYLNKSMLRSVSPCDNFYQFVCGSWTASRRRYTSVGQALYDSVSDAIQAQANNHPPTTRATATRKAYEMYLSCTQTHEVARTHESENSLRQFMAEHRLVISSNISGIDTVDLLVDLAVNWNLPFLFELAPHVYNASQGLMLIMYPGSLRRFFTVSEQTRAAFPEYLRAHLAKGFGNDTDVIALFHDFREWVEYATRVLHEPLTDAEFPWLEFSFSDLRKYKDAENINADAFLESVNRHYAKYTLPYGLGLPIRFTPQSKLFITDKRVLMALNGMLSSHQFIVPASSYVAWKVVELFGWALDNVIAEKRFGETDRNALAEARRVACAKFVERTYGFAMTARYLMEKVDTQMRDNVITLLTRIQDAMLRLVDRAPWMDARSREFFKYKVTEQKRYIWIQFVATYTTVLDRLYTDFPDMTENFVDNWIQSSKALANQMLLNTSSQYIGTSDPSQSRYVYHLNTLLIPMSLVFTPMYMQDGTPAMNYGGLGALYAQLLMKLFDTVGVRFNKDNDFTTWMSQSTENSHRLILQCLFREQSQVDVWERLAFELTYEAFVAQKLNAQAGLRLQGLEEFSDDAVFYMSYCYISCARTASKATPVRRPHVCNAIRTTAHFRETFKCPPLKVDEGRASSNCSPFWNLTYST